ncbi:MAG: cytidine deaminase [Myxococcota bacterium]
MTSQSESAAETISSETWDELYERALAVQQNAWAPYSKFHVGAALLLPDGEIVTGCNVENATYGATACAERTAVGCAVSKGMREFSAICIVTNLDEPAAPCGICRQVLAEFCDDLPIMLANPDGTREFVELDELLPHRFSGRDFADER